MQYACDNLQLDLGGNHLSNTEQGGGRRGGAGRNVSWMGNRNLQKQTHREVRENHLSNTTCLTLLVQHYLSDTTFLTLLV